MLLIVVVWKDRKCLNVLLAIELCASCLEANPEMLN